MGVGARHEREEGKTARVFFPFSLSSYVFSSLVMAMSVIPFAPRTTNLYLAFVSRRDKDRSAGFRDTLETRRAFSSIDMRSYPSYLVEPSYDFHNFTKKTDLSSRPGLHLPYCPTAMRRRSSNVYVTLVEVSFSFSTISPAMETRTRAPYLEDACCNRAHRYALLPSPLPPPVAPFSYVPCRRALPYPPPIPLRLLHSFSSSRRPLHLLPLPVPHHSSSSSSSASVLVVCSTPLARSPARAPVSLSVDSPGPPDQLFFLPVTVQISIPETPRGRWGCGPFVRARASVSHTRIYAGPDRVRGQWALSIFKCYD